MGTWLEGPMVLGLFSWSPPFACYRAHPWSWVELLVEDLTPAHIEEDMVSMSETGMNFSLVFLPEKHPCHVDSLLEAIACTVVSCETQPTFFPAVFEIERGRQGRF